MVKSRKTGLKVKYQRRKMRQFSDAFKQRQVKKISEGLLTVREVSNLYSVTVQSVYRWLDKYSKHHKQGTIQVVQMESEATKNKQLLERVAELERALGKKQMEIDLKDMIIELASKEYQVDLKKNFGTQPYKSSGKSSSQKDTQ